jgi:hypothetical protein
MDLFSKTPFLFLFKEIIWRNFFATCIFEKNPFFLFGTIEKIHCKEE